MRRDFANGFLIAEIFSRYYVHDVEMHSYDNGQSLQRKLDNWALLSKFFAKKGIKLDRGVINDVVHSKSCEAPAQLISAIYTLLTGRQPKRREIATVDPASIPSYARPNETSLLRSNITLSEEQTLLQDRDTHASKAGAILEEHHAATRTQLQEAALASKLATSYRAVASQRVMRGTHKPMTQETAAPIPVTFQDVKVRPVERNIAQLRANRDSPTSTRARGLDRQEAAGQTSVAPTPSSGDERELLTQPHVRGVLTILSEHVTAVAPHLNLTDRLAADPFNDFLKRLPTLESAAAASALSAAGADANSLAAACAASPHEAWALFHLLVSAIASAEHPAAAAAAADTLAATGRALLSRDATTAGQLLADFGFPVLVPLLKAAPHHATLLLEVVYAFTAPTDDGHIGTLKLLHDALCDQQAFLFCLAKLVRLEKSFSDELLDLYVYYAVIALSMPSARVRASALSMLPVLCGSSHALVLDMLPRLQVLVEDSWWEVRAQLARVAAALLSGGDCGPLTASVTGVLCSSLDCRSPAAQATALSVASPLLADLPSLTTPCVTALVALPPQQRALLLGQKCDTMPLPVGFEDVSPLPAGSYLPIAVELIASAKASALDRLGRSQVEVLAALCSGPFDANDEDAWRTWLAEAKDYCCAALCDEKLCELMATALLPLFTFLGEGSLPSFPTLLSSLRILFPEGAAACQEAMVEFLDRLLDSGAPFAAAIASLVGGLDRDLVKTSALSRLVERVERETSK